LMWMLQHVFWRPSKATHKWVWKEQQEIMVTWLSEFPILCSHCGGIFRIKEDLKTLIRALGGGSFIWANDSNSVSFHPKLHLCAEIPLSLELNFHKYHTKVSSDILIQKH
jgi:hypothetical protein